MKRNNKKDLLPEEFKTLEELSNFWDSHDVTDYAEYLTPVECSVASHPTHEYVIVLSDKLNRSLQEAQSREGVSIETLVNLWVKDGLQKFHSR